ncbi:hypothetical protein [Planktotalea sp.]|uniref:lysozyme inhibitor LprI family protein n=1 Tax=Planktotalea sp. TaxID=2029877 RepID=UPI0025D99556|nr:hypothetical protein [Planktotalea sp.]
MSKQSIRRPTLMIRSLFISLILLVGAPSSTLATSFDCARAATETEIAICNSVELSNLDDVLASLYQLKRQIDLNTEYFESNSSEYEAHGYETPVFSPLTTQAKQRSWIQNVQTGCNGDVNCLVRAYQDRIADYFYRYSSAERASDVSPDWRITNMLNLPNSAHSVVVWRYDFPDNPDQMAQPYIYIIAIHDRENKSVVSINYPLLGYVEDSYRVIEIDMSASSEVAFSINISEMRSAGGWGASSTTFSFHLEDKNYLVSKIKMTSWARNLLIFEHRVVDFQQGMYSQRYENSSGEPQEIDGNLLAIDQEITLKRPVQSLPVWSFEQVSNEALYSLITAIHGN